MKDNNLMLEKAIERVNLAQAELDSALESGHDTTDPRSRLELAQAELARVRAELQKDRQGNAETARAKMADEAFALVSEQQDRIVADLARLIDPVRVPAVDLPIGPATALLEARTRLEKVQGEAQAAKGRVEGLRGRLSALERERSQVVYRRAQGDTRPDDGSVLALLDADLEGLSGLLTQAQAAVPNTSDTQAAVAAAEQAWGRYVREAYLGGLQALCASLDEALAGAASELTATVAAVDGRANASRRWRASHALRLNLL